MQKQTAGADIWMPIHIGDYLGETTHLTTVEHGVYFLLMLTYWKHGPLPDDDKRLALIARLDVTQYVTLKSQISPFFQIGGGFWRHKRLDEEIRKARRNMDLKKKASALGNYVRWGPTRNPCGIPEGFPNGVPNGVP